ncbi:hypothetical protein PGTUg99_007260 [Puccinia graminis f. sp. tritici]|uniref:Uncharacterized protein n=1 Tax=Puccinia graminis f. sp. tritici TaxID=56615 RepID=A0A5B0NIN2_PUCGR|nr:hypothetical protein PGTUg99_007260 [Puccinia graminis f. sp. tritici]
MAQLNFGSRQAACRAGALGAESRTLVLPLGQVRYGPITLSLTFGFAKAPPWPTGSPDFLLIGGLAAHGQPDG